MTFWKKCEENNQVFYISEFGGIHEDADGKFVAVVPATAKLGPFDSLNEAEQTVEQSVSNLRSYLDNFNDSLLQALESEKLDLSDSE